MVCLKCRKNRELSSADQLETKSKTYQLATLCQPGHLLSTSFQQPPLSDISPRSFQLFSWWILRVLSCLPWIPFRHSTCKSHPFLCQIPLLLCHLLWYTLWRFLHTNLYVKFMPSICKISFTRNYWILFTYLINFLVAGFPSRCLLVTIWLDYMWTTFLLFLEPSFFCALRNVIMFLVGRTIKALRGIQLKVIDILYFNSFILCLLWQVYFSNIFALHIFHGYQSDQVQSS